MYPLSTIVNKRADSTTSLLEAFYCVPTDERSLNNQKTIELEISIPAELNSDETRINVEVNPG